MHIIPDTQIVKPTEQWSPYPEGTNAVACTETMKSIDYAASFFMDIAPGDAPPMDPRIRFGESVPVQMIAPLEFRTLKPMVPGDTMIGFYGPCAEGNRALVQLSISREQAAKLEEGTKPISMGFTPAICEDSAIMRARDWLESDGIPEAIGTDDEDTKPCAPRASEPVYPGQSLAW